jgi:hypothetical protein
MNVLHPHLSPNRRARPTMSGIGDAKVTTTTTMMRNDRAADAPRLAFAAYGRDATLRPGTSSSPASSPSHCAPSSSAALDANDSRSASGSLASGAAEMISQSKKRGPPHPASRATTTTTTATTKPAGASTFSSKIAESLGGGGGGRSLHLLFKRSTSHTHRYLSVADGGEGSSDEFAGIMGEMSPSPPPSPSKGDCMGDPVKVSMIIADGSDSLTDEGYDGFAAGSWHSQETLRQSTKASSAAPASPQSVIIRDAAELEAAASCPSTPYSRRRRRRSSMPLMNDAGRMGTTIAETPRSSPSMLPPGTSHHATSLPVACNWTDPARRTLWVTSPGSARAHLEFNPRSFVASEDDDEEPDLAPCRFQHDGKGTVFPSLNRTGGEYNGRPGPSFHDLPTSSSASPDTGRRQYQYQRRHSSAGGGTGVRRHSTGVGSGVVACGSFPAFRGLIDNARRDGRAPR